MPKFYWRSSESRSYSTSEIREKICLKFRVKTKIMSSPLILIVFLHLRTLFCRCSSFSVHEKICFVQMIPCRGRKFLFCSNISCLYLKNSDFAQISETWMTIGPCSPAGTISVFFKVWLEKPLSNFKRLLIFFLLFLNILRFVYTVVEADFERPLDNFERPFWFLKMP